MVQRKVEAGDVSNRRGKETVAGSYPRIDQCHGVREMTVSLMKFGSLFRDGSMLTVSMTNPTLPRCYFLFSFHDFSTF